MASIILWYVSMSMIREISTTPVQRGARTLEKMKRLQAEFQADDGKPIWLKRGICDRILYTSTIVGCFLGFAMVCLTVYDNAKPESWKTKKTC
ncbi:cytochrome c oxidase subunit 7A1, mitochondrial-like isoform X2 [Choristoneura fumiferana]|uniref:cytochrome c oxidase subunit 7A1, mitochondrial-like isoform X2 n=1 Tax=Choristoneura fumiferana TaxID=7141 RepID=UPI003D15DA9F